MSEEKIGLISHYFGNISVAGIDIEKKKLEVGDTIHIKGHTTDFTQTIKSMQIDLQEVKVAKKGDSMGLKVSERVREHDVVFKVS
ncbi:translation elongation factor-like protein [Candidatus Neomarinimicrobiota bacterium]